MEVTIWCLSTTPGVFEIAVIYSYMLHVSQRIVFEHTLESSLETV